jgi:uncharacterized HAD superfamily protein
MKIGIDLDDTLSYTIPEMVEFHNKNYGTNLKPEDYKKYEQWYIWSETLEEALKRLYEFHTSDYGENIKPILYAKDILDKAKENNQIFVITARSKNIEKETRDWLEKYYPNIFSKIYFTDNYSKENKKVTKKGVCDELGIDIFIEDNLQYATECANPERKVYLLDYPWNQSESLPENVKRVKDWKEIDIINKSTL